MTLTVADLDAIAERVADALERRGLVRARRRPQPDDDAPLTAEERRQIAAKVRARSRRLGLPSRAAR